MEKKLVIEKMLGIYKVQSLSGLTTSQLATIYDMVNEPSPFGSAVQICDESDHDERLEFSKVLTRCLEGKQDIFIYRVQNEGVRTDENEEYFKWSERHSCWYQ